jgi:hypothetical protein
MAMQRRGAPPRVFDIMARTDRSSHGIGLDVATVNLTVSTSTVSNAAMLLRLLICDEFSALARSKLKTTSALVKGLPSWNMTPRRNSSSQVVASRGLPALGEPQLEPPVLIVV